jgi:hypothetical protein
MHVKNRYCILKTDTDCRKLLSLISGTLHFQELIPARLIDREDRKEIPYLYKNIEAGIVVKMQQLNVS